MIGVIVAMNADRVIGVNGGIPWKYPGDLRRFKEVTMGSTVIMGRKTWESIPAKFRPLSGRNNVVVSRDTTWPAILGVRGAQVAHTEGSIQDALLPVNEWMRGDVWFIGGARIYAEAMQYADVIDVTWVPWATPNWVFTPDARVSDSGSRVRLQHPLLGTVDEVVFFPKIYENVFAPGEITAHPYEPELRLQRFERRYALKDNELLRQQGSLRR